MKVKKKHLLCAGTGILGLAICSFILVVAINSQFRRGIPEYPDVSDMPVPVKDQLQEAFQEADRKPTAENIGRLGMVYHSSAMYDMASRCYRLAIRKNKSEWKWSYYLGYLNLELGNSENVIEDYTRVIRINPDAGLAWYYLGEAYSNLGNYDSAEISFSRIVNGNNFFRAKEPARIDHFPLSVYALFQLSKIYINNGRLELAEKNLKDLIDRNDLFGPAYRLLGNIYNMKGDIPMAEEYNVRANDLLPFSSPVDTLIDKLALISRSELYLLKKIDEAAQNSYADWVLKLTQQGLKYMPDNEYLVSKAIEFYLRMGMVPKIGELTVQHINHFRNNYNEIGRMGALFFQHGMYKEAGDYLAIAWALRSDNIEVLEHLAISLWNSDEKQKAVVMLTIAEKSFRDNPGFLADIGYTYLRFEKTEQATLCLKKLKQVSPNDPGVQKLAAKIAEINKEEAAAISSYESSFKGNPEDTETINSLGSLLRRNKMWGRYLNLYQEALKFHPNNPEFLNTLGSFLLGCPDESLRDLDEGIKYCKRAFINVSSPPSLMVTSGKNLAIAYYRKRDKQNALHTISKTINISRTTNITQAERNELEKLHRAIQEL